MNPQVTINRNSRHLLKLYLSSVDMGATNEKSLITIMVINKEMP